MKAIRAFLMMIRWILYIIHFILYLIYSVLLFISKPGTTLLVPLVMSAVSWFALRPIIHKHFTIPMDFNDFNSDLADVVGIFVLVLFCTVYVLVSRFLEKILGIFPPITRPLRPIARLKATSEVIASVRVRIVVPPLRGTVRPQ